MTDTKDDLVERLRLAAERASNISRQMAEDKSLRQDSNTERRTDLYMWPTPEQTIEGRALARIATLETQVEALRDALRFYQNGFEPYKEHKHLPGFAWRPKELLLDDCGETARAALALKMDQPK